MTATGREPHPAEPYWTAGEVDLALDALREGRLALVKGDIGYGLFGTSEAAIRRMYMAKGRSYGNPCIFIGSLPVLDEIGDLPSPLARQWCHDVSEWTTVAVIARARSESPLLTGLDPWVRSRSVTRGTLAVFLRTGPFIAELVERAFAEGWVFVGSSANRSGSGNNYRLEDVPAEIVDAADVVIDHGSSAYANSQRLATTMVNLTDWTVRRRGVNAGEIVDSFSLLAARHGGGLTPPGSPPASRWTDR